MVYSELNYNILVKFQISYRLKQFYSRLLHILFNYENMLFLRPESFTARRHKKIINHCNVYLVAVYYCSLFYPTCVLQLRKKQENSGNQPGPCASDISNMVYTKLNDNILIKVSNINEYRITLMLSRNVFSFCD